MNKKLVLNFLLLFMTYIIPLYVLYTARGSMLKTKLVQVPVFVTLFVGSILFCWINWKREENSKWKWLVFKIIGILGFLFSGVILYLLFIFRNGIGF